ncbi:unnamed protein product, partial [marine sediment metagenome]
MQLSGYIARNYPQLQAVVNEIVDTYGKLDCDGLEFDFGILKFTEKAASTFEVKSPRINEIKNLIGKTLDVEKPELLHFFNFGMNSVVTSTADMTNVCTLPLTAQQTL